MPERDSRPQGVHSHTHVSVHTGTRRTVHTDTHLRGSTQLRSQNVQTQTHTNLCACTSACHLHIRAYAPDTHGRVRSQAGQGPDQVLGGRAWVFLGLPPVCLSPRCRRHPASQAPVSQYSPHPMTPPRQAAVGTHWFWLHGDEEEERLLLTARRSPLLLRRNALPSPGLGFPGCKTEGWFLGMSRSGSASLPNYTALILPTLAACFLEPSADNSLSPYNRRSDGGACWPRDHPITELFGEWSVRPPCPDGPSEPKCGPRVASGGEVRNCGGRDGCTGRL